jgi:exoribonuclease R
MDDERIESMEDREETTHGIIENHSLVVNKTVAKKVETELYYSRYCIFAIRDT